MPTPDQRRDTPQTRRRLNRRQWLSHSLLAGAACSLASGCVPMGSGDVPDLVWGRRGQSDGRFLKPRAITIDRRDRLYIVDTTGRIQVFDADGNQQRVWKTPETANGRPTGLSIRYADNIDDDCLLVADTHYYRTLVYTLQGELLPEQQIGGTPGQEPGQFAFVTEAVCDHDGCYYIGEYGDSDRIQKFDPDRRFMTQWGGTGRERDKFVRPQSLIVEKNVLWVADACNHRIKRFDITTPTPSLIDVWGGSGDGSTAGPSDGPSDGPGDGPGEYSYPYDIALASDGSLLVCEYGNQRIQRISPDGEPISIWGGPGFQPGQLYQPWGLVIDSLNRVHVLDSNNHRVQRYSLKV
ncbi:NHL repeat-containing protein [Stieleria varia]|uniref:NHL repeat protein n=1 Tax=Stieleria varia TaxID=2528005 RepID=A0A5C6B614_9BACT|nr:SMP-30/gluconolactonase/LRE family protein [Stieleria varia]TWU07725.1 NHL repeat protein [Stieleria varia]